jgi:hypothetical protein
MILGRIFIKMTIKIQNKPEKQTIIIKQKIEYQVY